MADTNCDSAGGYVLSDYIPLPNPFYTTGVQNIEKRYSAGGGSATHQPAVATKLGSHDDQSGNVEEGKGIGTPYFRENYSEQKPDVSGILADAEDARGFSVGGWISGLVVEERGCFVLYLLEYYADDLSTIAELVRQDVE